MARTRRPQSSVKEKGPNPIDVNVGARVRLRRNMLGLSQEKLGEAIGLTFQQIQKYERGANRIGASRLHQLSRVLDVPVSFFYDNLDPVRAPSVDDSQQALPENDPEHPNNIKETIELAESYFAIEDLAVRKRLLDLAKSLAAKDESVPHAPRRRGRPRK